MQEEFWQTSTTNYVECRENRHQQTVQVVHLSQIWYPPVMLGCAWAIALVGNNASLLHGPVDRNQGHGSGNLCRVNYRPEVVDPAELCHHWPGLLLSPPPRRGDTCILHGVFVHQVGEFFLPPVCKRFIHVILNFLLHLC